MISERIAALQTHHARSSFRAVSQSHSAVEMPRIPGTGASQDAMRCPLCGAADPVPMWDLGDRLFGTTQRRFTLQRCANCALRFLAPPPLPAELASFYPEGYWLTSPRVPGGDVGRQRLIELYRRLVLFDHVRFASAIVREQQQRGTWRGLLDIGCGDGSFLSALGAAPAVGLDRSPSACLAVRRRGFPAVLGEPSATPFGERSFSLVTMFHYLEHVASAQASLEAVRHLLAPHGRLVVQVPNADSWQAALLGRLWSGYDPPRHLVNYSARTLRRTLDDNGFEVLRVSHFSVRDNPTMLVISLLPRLYPPERLIRAPRKPAALRELAAALVYMALVWGSYPLTLVESLFGHGAAVTFEARVRGK